MRSLLAAALVVLFEGLSVATLFPVINFRALELGGTAGFVGLLFALVAAPKVLANPLWGWVSDRVGRRGVLVIATLGTFSGSALWALADSTTGLAVSRLVVGLFGAQATLAAAVVADVTEPEKRAGGMAVLGVAFGLSFMVGPLIGGTFGEWIGYGQVGWICAGMQGMSLLVIAAMLPETRNVRSTAGTTGAAELVRTEGETLVQLLRNLRVAELLLVTLTFTLSSAVLFSTLGLFLEKSFEFDGRTTGYVFGFIGLIAVLVQGGLVRPLTPRFGERNVGLAGVALLAAGYVVMGLGGGLILFLFGAALAATGSALAGPCLMSLLSQAVSPASQGAVQGLYQAGTGVGRAVGFGLGGFLFGIGRLSPFWAAALSAGVAVVLMVLVGRTPLRVATMSATPSQDA